MMRCSLQHVTWHGVLVWRQPDIKEILRQMQLIQATGSFWKKAEQTELVREKEGESVKVSLRGDGEELNCIYLQPLYGNFHRSMVREAGKTC